MSLQYELTARTPWVKTNLHLDCRPRGTSRPSIVHPLERCDFRESFRELPAQGLKQEPSFCWMATLRSPYAIATHPAHRKTAERRLAHCEPGSKRLSNFGGRFEQLSRYLREANLQGRCRRKRPPWHPRQTEYPKAGASLILHAHSAKKDIQGHNEKTSFPFRSRAYRLADSRRRTLYIHSISQ